MYILQLLQPNILMGENYHYFRLWNNRNIFFYVHNYLMIYTKLFLDLYLAKVLAKSFFLFDDTLIFHFGQGIHYHLIPSFRTSLRTIKVNTLMQ